MCRYFFFNDTATTEIYTLSLHDALPISEALERQRRHRPGRVCGTHPRTRLAGRVRTRVAADHARRRGRSEEHTSELQSRQYLVCRLLLEKKKNSNYTLHQLYIYAIY